MKEKNTNNNMFQNGTKTVFNFVPPSKPSEVSIMPPEEEKKGNHPIQQKRDEREKNLKPQLQVITTFRSQHGEMI